MTKYSGGEGSMNQEQGSSRGILPSSLENKGYHAITTTPPIPETGHFTDERRISFEPAVGTVSEGVKQARKLWEDKETVVDPRKLSLLVRLTNVLESVAILGVSLSATGGAGLTIQREIENKEGVQPAAIAVPETAVRDYHLLLQKVGAEAVVPPVFDNKAEENVLGRNNSFYVTPEEYKEKGLPTVEEISERENINIPFFIRFNDGKEHIIYAKKHSDGWDISGDLQGGELLVPARENGEIKGGGGSDGMPYIYKPGMSFSRFSSWEISLADEKGGKISFIITAGALQTAKDLVLQRDKRGIDRGPVKGFAPIGTLLDNQPVFIAANVFLPDGKISLKRGRTNIATISTGQAYVLR